MKMLKMLKRLEQKFNKNKNEDTNKELKKRLRQKQESRTDNKECKVDEEGYGDEVNRKIFDTKRLVGQKLQKIWFEVTAEDILTHGEVIGESEDELKELVWLVAKEEEDDYEEEYEHGSD